jgi:protoporphyrinogen/coproporphyrinogen III oxidase
VTAVRLAVVGGGITGLVAALEATEKTGEGVVVLEASDRFGGVIETSELDGVRVEGGPDSFLAREPDPVELCAKLGIADELVAPAVFGALVWSASGPKRLPAGSPYGLPVSPKAAWRAGLLSAGGALRASAEVMSPRQLDGADVSIADFIRRRFGREVLERLVDPLLAGTRAGDTGDMSLAAALPSVDHLARTHRSLLRALQAARRSGELPATAPPFQAPRRGMGSLVDALVERLAGSAELRLGTEVKAVSHSREDTYELELESGTTLAARAVVAAVPAHRAAPLLHPLSVEAAAGLRAIRHASVAVATLIYPPETTLPAHGSSGLLVPGGAGLTLSACTWVSAKWPQAAPPDGRKVIRCFVGRSGRHPALDLDDEALVRRLSRDLDFVAGVGAHPAASKVTRWERALPQYSVGHLERLGKIERALGRHHGIALAGASYRGSGLPECIRQGRQAADRALV